MYLFCPRATGGTKNLFDCLHSFPYFSASSEAIFKIQDAMCRKIDDLSIFGALIDQIFVSNSPITSISRRTKYVHFHK